MKKLRWQLFRVSGFLKEGDTIREKRMACSGIKMAALFLLCASALAWSDNPQPKPKRPTHPVGKHQVVHHEMRPLTPREKQQRAFLKAEQKRQNKLAKGQRKDARRNTHTHR
jgi:hypothetical protein